MFLLLTFTSFILDGVGIIGKSVPIELLKDKYGLNSENSEVLDKLKWEVRVIQIYVLYQYQFSVIVL